MEYLIGAPKKKRGVKRRAFELALIYFTVSHLGWLFEKVGRYLVYGSLSDRGFLSMPLCPIYATALVGAYLLLGTPRKIRIFGRRLEVGRVRGFCLYFLLSAILATAVELCIGAIFGEIAGIYLWDYSERSFNLFGYVCLSFSLLWGAAITLFMSSVWRGLDAAARRIPQAMLTRLCFALYSVMALDFAFNLFYLFKTGSHFNFL